MKREAVKVLLSLAEDKKQEVSLRCDCAKDLGEFGEKNKAVDILITLYLAQPNEYEEDAKKIYNFLWDLTL